MTNVRILVPISGGKDSQACLKLALQQHPASEVRGLFCDTQFEHPITYAHVEKLRSLYGAIQIDTVCAGSVEEKCLKYGRFPGGGARHCTDELKIQPTKKYCKALAEQQGQGFEVWYGMRSGESTERATRYSGKVCNEVYAPHEVLKKYPKYLSKMGVSFRLAVLSWSELDVHDFIGRADLNPLYWDGFPRVGCFPCQAGGDKWKEKAYQYDEFGRQQHRKVIRIGQEINKPIWNSKGGVARNNDNDNAVCALVCGG